MSFVTSSNVTATGSTISKNAGLPGWNGWAFSQVNFNSCYVRANPLNTNTYAMIGLAVLQPLPAADINSTYFNINYAWYNDSGQWFIFESGVNTLSNIAPVAPTDLVAITYDGVNVKYWLNNVLIRTVPVANQTFFMQAALYSPGSGFSNVAFGQGSSYQLAITTSSTLPPALVGFPYSLALTASGGVPPYVWFLQSVPNNAWIQTTSPNFGIPNGVINGTPPAAGTSNFVIEVFDSGGSPVSAINASLQIVDTTNAQNYTDLITSEHNQKLKFMQLVTTLTAGMGDVTALIESIPAAFDLNQAVGVQLDILGQWIGQSRVIPGILIPGFFGFSELSTGQPDGLQLPFGELTHPSIGGIFFELNGTAAGTTVLTDPQYLTILKARIARNQSNGTLSALEEALSFIFGAGCKVVDNGTLNLAITVTSPITPVDQSLLTGLDILPRPAGVAIGSIVFTQ